MQAGSNAKPSGWHLKSTYFPLLRQGVLAMSLVAASSVQAAGEVTEVQTKFEQPTPYQYSAQGVDYLWGIGQNELLDGFFYNGHHHSVINAADLVTLKRVDIPGVATGEPCGVFAESDGNPDELLAGFPLGADGSCDMESMLAGYVINRGTLDTFSNTGPAPKNIERVDFIYSYGLLSSLSDAGLDVGGHIVAEKRGNNSVKIAAITSLDSNGEPSGYGDLVQIHPAGCADPDICYGVTAVRHQYSFLQSASVAPQQYPEHLAGDTENMAVAFVSSRHLGLAVGQKYYGFSVFGRDVDTATHDLVDPATFPQDSADDYIIIGDGADLYGGMASVYWDDEASVTEAGSIISGSAFIDQNGNNIFDDSDVGLGGIDISLYADTNGNSAFDPSVDQLLTVVTTDTSGQFVFPGVADGSYFAELDENNDAIPAGVAIPDGANPVAFDVNGGNVDNLNFSFVTVNNDGAVSAQGDAVSIRQDTSTDIAVLANDIDPVGAGLTITNVSGASHGVVTINGDQVNYAPNPGYNGADSFSYTVADGNGAESTATVAVTVLRFSDINENGIDDFEECDCDDIRLLTGIHGSGVGGGGNGLWLLMLVTVFPLRRIFKLARGESA